MLGRLNQLDSSIITRADTDIGRQRNLRQTHGTRVWVVGRASYLERRHNRVAHILGNLAESKVDINQGILMAREPARLEGESTTADRPLGSVG